LLQAKELTVQGNGQAFTLLEQSKESEVQPVGRARGNVRTRVEKNKYGLAVYQALELNSADIASFAAFPA
jgi:hypothetical protein